MTPAPVSHGPLAASAAGGPPGPDRQPFSPPAVSSPAVSSPAVSSPAVESPTSGPSAVDPPSGKSPELRPNWPSEETPEQRPDWRERFALGTDLALIGVVVTAAALPVLTLPAAMAAGSTAVRHRYRAGRLPAFRPLLRQFRRGLLPGIPFVLIALLLLIDLIAVSRGWVPGGTPVLVVTALAAAWLAGLATLALVAVGRDPDAPGKAALRWAWHQATGHPWSALAPALSGVLAFFLALSVPATIPLVIGFHLFAAHVISDRLAPTDV